MCDGGGEGGGGWGVEADDESPLISECLNVGRYDDV